MPRNEANVLALPIRAKNARNFRALARVRPAIVAVVVPTLFAMVGPNRPNVLARFLAMVVLRPFTVFLTASADAVVRPVMLATLRLTSVRPNLLVATLFPDTVLWKPFAHVLPPSSVLRSPLDVFGTVLVSRP